MKLVIGSKNYSSWSMRAWLMLSHFDLEFEEIGIALFTEGYEKELAKYSPAGKVPVLLDRGVEIWDSLAICEYISEEYLQFGGWPRQPMQRARCRAIAAEMHSGFANIRTELPMNCRARRRVSLSAPVLKEISRVDDLWSDAIQSSGGPYLFGEFSIADCMYAPLVSRFSTYQVNLSCSAQKYSQAMHENPSFRAWLESAVQETQTIDICEVGEDDSSLSKL